jgi:hypothetical protein
LNKLSSVNHVHHGASVRLSREAYLISQPIRSFKGDVTKMVMPNEAIVGKCGVCLNYRGRSPLYKLYGALRKQWKLFRLAKVK